MFISRPFSFSTSWSFRCQLMFSWLTGRGREAKGTGMCQVHTHLTCCRLNRKWLPNCFHPIYYFHFSASCRWSETGPLSSQHLENLLCGQWVEWDPNHPQDQPDFSDNGRALLSRSKSHINALHNLVFLSLFFTADILLCNVQVLQFSNLALRDPLSTLERSSQAYTPSYSLILRYGLAATLWLCIGFLQVHLPLFFFSHFLFFSNKIQKIQVLAQSPLLKMYKFLPIGDLLYCVSWALCWGQNPSVCRSLLHQ